MSTVLNDGFRVFTSEEVKLVRATATLWNLNDRGIKCSDFVTFERASVPVYEGYSNRPLGSASLFMREGKIMAFISFDYASPERLDLEVSIPVYAIPEGAFYLRGTDFVMDYVDVTAIILFTSPPVESYSGGKLELFRVEGSSE